MQVQFRSAFHMFRPVLAVSLASMIFSASMPTHAADEVLEEVAEMPEDEELSDVLVEGAAGPPAAAEIERESVAVTDAVTVQDIARTGDSDVAASLKRVAGVSVQGGRFAVVRGLAARYISNTLNGDLMASTNPYRRDVELDLFPADILSGIEIQKSFTADMPGDTTGGAIGITTRDPEARFAGKVSAKVGGTRGVTGRNLYTYPGGDTDWLGVDDGIRELPAIIDQITNGGRSNPTLAESQQYAGQLPNIYNLRQKKAGQDFGVSAALGNGFLVGDGLLNVYGAFSYDNGNESHQEGTRLNARYSRDAVNVELNGYLAASYEGDTWKISSKTMILRQTDDTAEFESGFDFSYDVEYDKTLLEFKERQFFAEQIQAAVALGPGTLALRAGFSNTRSDTPDRRSYRYNAGRFDPGSLERLYANLDEDDISFGVDYDRPVFWGDAGNSTTVRIGGLYDMRSRTNDLVRLTLAPVEVTSTATLEELLTPQNFADGTFRLRGQSTDTDSYEADQDSLAVYVSTETEIGDAITVVAGLRMDNFETELRFPNSTRAPEAKLTSDELLPSLGLIYRVGTDWQFRGGYSRTVSRPSISELSPSVYFDDRGRRFTGCTVETVSGLLPCDASDIDNFDLRAEYYFNRSDSVSLALFYKDIDKPLERGVIDGVEGYTFRNGDSAELFGIELDGQYGWNFGGHELTLGANVSYIDSKITLDDDGQRLEGIVSRKLQGQSPVLANARLSYEHIGTQQVATLSYSYFETRIDVAGGNNLQPVYEKGRNSVNLTYEKRFAGGARVGLKLVNLTNDDNVFVRRSNADIETVIERWKTGRGGEISFAYEF